MKFKFYNPFNLIIKYYVWIQTQVRVHIGLNYHSGNHFRSLLWSYAYCILLLLFPIWIISGFVMGVLIFIHFGWTALAAYLVCKFTGVCPI